MSTEAKDEGRNIWQELLKEAIDAGADNDARMGEENVKNLILCGDKKNGKTAMLSKFSNRTTIKDTPEYILDYSYINVKNKFSQDTEEILGQLNVWQLDDDKHISLLDQLVEPASLKQTAFVITIDLSQPWAILDTLNKWLAVISSTSERWLAGMTEEEQAALKLRISKAVQFYKEEKKSSPAAEEAGAADEKAAEDGEAKEEVAAEEAKGDEGDAKAEEEKVAKPPPPSTEMTEEEQAQVVNTEIPALNLGIPIVVVGLKADFFQRQLSKAGADDKFEFVLQRLRTECLKFGGSLVYTSAVGTGTNVELLQDYLYHRIFDFPFTRGSKVVGSSDDFGIFVPTGYDSEALISAGGPAKGGWGAETPLTEVFGGPAAAAEEKKEASLVEAQDNVLFFKMLAQQLEQGGSVGSATPGKAKSAKPPPPSGGDAPAGKKQAQQKAVKSFFKSLLNEKSDKNVRADAQKALGEMQNKPRSSSKAPPPKGKPRSASKAPPPGPPPS